MFKKTLSQTLNCEIDLKHPHNTPLLTFKRWSDKLRPPFRDLAHRTLLRYMVWWYEKPISPHCLPLEEQVENVRDHYGSDPGEGKDQGGYRWDGEGDWHH